MTIIFDLKYCAILQKNCLKTFAEKNYICICLSIVLCLKAKMIMIMIKIVIKKNLYLKMVFRLFKTRKFFLQLKNIKRV